MLAGVYHCVYVHRRYHYFSEDAKDEHGPSSYESEDIRLLREEIERARADLKRLMELREECVTIERQRARATASPSIKRAVSGARPATSPQTKRGARSQSSIPTRSASASAKTSRPGSKQTKPLTTPAARQKASEKASDTDTTTATAQTDGSSPPSSVRSLSSISTDSRLTSAASSLVDVADGGGSGSGGGSSGSDGGGGGSDRDTTSATDITPLQSESATSLLSEDCSQFSTSKRHRKKSLKQPKSSKSSRRSSEKWLQTHGLAAQHLTIMDALRTTVIPQSSKFVPVLNKHVSSKVFDSVMPMRHIEDGSGKVCVVNPQAVDLSLYEAKLKSTLSKMEGRLDSVILEALPKKERSKLPADVLGAFREDRDSLTEALEKLKWPAPRAKQDVLLLLEEINTGKVYLQQSIAIRKSSTQDSDQIQSILSNPSVMKTTLETLRAKTPTERRSKDRRSATPNRSRTPAASSKRPPSSAVPMDYRLQLARYDRDGYYYTVSVRETLNPRNVVVMFPNGHEQQLAQRHLVTIDITKSRPKLMVGDCVLVQTSRPIPGMDENKEDGDAPAMTCFVPAQVTAVPRQTSSSSLPSPPPSPTPATAFYTLSLYTSCKITAFRTDLIKLTRSQYSFATRYILSAAKTGGSVQLTLHPEPGSQQRSLSSSPRTPKDLVSISDKDRQLDALAPLRSAHPHLATYGLVSQGLPTTPTGPLPAKDQSTPPVTPLSARGGNANTRDDIDNASLASSTSSVTRQRRFSAHTLQQLSEQTAKLQSLHGELVASATQDRSSIAEQCATLVQQHEQAMDLSQQLRLQHADQALELKSQLLAEHEAHQASLKSAFEASSGREAKQRQAILEEHQKQVASLTAALSEQTELQKHIENHQHEQERSFSMQREQLTAIVESLERRQKEMAQEATKEHEQHKAEQEKQQQQLAKLLQDMKQQQEELQLKQEELERAQEELAAKSAVEEERKQHSGGSGSVIDGKGDAEAAAPSTPLYESIMSSGMMDGLPEGSTMERTVTEEGEDAVLLRRGDVAILVAQKSPDRVRIDPPSSSGITISVPTPSPPPPPLVQQPIAAPQPAVMMLPIPLDFPQAQRALAPGEEGVFRSDEDGWYFPGIIQGGAVGKGSYSVLNGSGVVEVVPRQSILPDADNVDDIINSGDPVIALHPSFVCSYAPGYVNRVKRNGDFKVVFYDGEKGRVQRRDVYPITPEFFTETCAFIRRQEAGIVGEDVIARYDRDGFYYPSRVLSQQGPSQSYAVKFTQSGVLHTQMQQHIFSHSYEMAQPEIVLGCRVLAPLDSDGAVYLPGWVSSEKDSLLAITFINGEQRRSVHTKECHWMSTLYYNQSLHFWNTLPTTAT